MIAVTDNRTFRAAQHFPSPVGTGSAVSAWLCGSIGLFYLTMLVREPVHGMQGLLEKQRKDMSHSVFPLRGEGRIITFRAAATPSSGSCRSFFGSWSREFPASFDKVILI
jgi:hypothetical protein